MSNQEQPKTEEKESEQKPETPDIKHLSKLFFLSYKFSQGNGIDQKYIFQYIKTKHPDWKLTKDMEKVLTASLVRSVEYFTSNKQLHQQEMSGERDIHASLESEVFNFAHQLEKEPESKNLIKILVESVVGSDYKFLISKGGRPRSESDRPTSTSDSFLSHLIYYGFLGHKTGAEEYDDMFREITDHIRAGNLSGEDLNRLKEIVFVWNEKHPDQKIDLEKELGAEV
ncbi:MAG: hypothetical protein A3B86_01410 [Candidatus Yanofskybacteria bacterium RIFCSPHIGHO2_02_FULL_38_22b]|uniref:Uncharacterized protein n=1 Tax=Candidatus Yanofskybacteria bacterium RIFCSPHIGHO2_02_FULL_38_22b TaxID=1802673 RepID=A0A1F8F558_9BACT|nr:MAG: hypothetical protein A3B86_01410 [Candidatus Yanofskybacteria bacterium RIFCSPHIGHO2_02_FULL_38_22b]OGN20471.1 MAG: hypothetical protein A2910_02270 [Candidatus Yanofskybacteria bacterium RIFCSPLOWO2_01_FULL_39_28]